MENSTADSFENKEIVHLEVTRLLATGQAQLELAGFVGCQIT
ncbi:MAG: hypothetical protein OXI52_07175 [Caldilineaceae bacterium]|nr:hypothetical protein [Caldilineaceae bacterium]